MRTDLTAIGNGIIRVAHEGRLATLISARTITHAAQVGDDMHVHWSGGWIVAHGWAEEEFAELWQEALSA